jgi:hypothetical protein
MICLSGPILCFDGFFSPFHQSPEIAHPEQAGDKTVRIKTLEVLDRFPAADKHNAAFRFGNC